MRNLDFAFSCETAVRSFGGTQPEWHPAKSHLGKGGMPRFRGDVPSQCMRRTNIYLSEEEHRLLSERARLENTSMADVVRRMLDRALGLAEGQPSPVDAIRQSAGLWADRTEIELEELRAFRRRERDFDRA